MTAPVEVPAEAYQLRAANNPVPFRVPYGVTPLTHGRLTAFALAAAVACYYPDVSEFQPPYTTAFPYPIAGLRFHSGFRIDNNVRASWAVLQQMLAIRHVRVVIAYAVFIPGQLQRVLADMKAVFGQTCPTNRLVIMNDMESGAGFAGPGNHSAEANQWEQAFADYTGNSANWLRETGYANAGDWASNWPQYDQRMKQHIAAYNGKNPGGWAWQYAGGNPAYPVPPGAPRTCAPWGDRYIDMNVIFKTIDQIEADLGIVTIAPPLPPEEEKMQIEAILWTTVNDDTTPNPQTWLTHPNIAGWGEHIVDGNAMAAANAMVTAGAFLKAPNPIRLSYLQTLPSFADFLRMQAATVTLTADQLNSLAAAIAAITPAAPTSGSWSTNPA